MIQVTEKEQELLHMIRRRDTDVESAVTLLHISRQKFDTMIQKLLQLEMLQYLSDNEVKLTEKGIQYLSDVHKKK
jgi:Mn-dependent DtxR family transcriptional regulator